MALRFLHSGGNFYNSQGVSVPGIWSSTAGSSLSTSAPAGRADTYAFEGEGIYNLGATYSGGILGGAFYIQSAMAAEVLLAFNDASGNPQCDVRTTSVGTFQITRNGTVLGTSSVSVFFNSWFYLEFKALLSTSLTGTCEVRLNGTVILTLTSQTNATTTALFQFIRYGSNFGGSGATEYIRDMYGLDTTTGTQTSYLGDINVQEFYPNGAGTNSAWSVFQPSFALTAAANTSGGTTVYTGTITDGGTNAYQGYYFSVSGFGNANNNGGPWLCTANTTTSITLQNPNGVLQTGATATCAFQNPVQSGIHGGYADEGATTNVGTRPQADNIQYIYSNTTNQLTDYAHTQIGTFTGTIQGVVHVTYARKDDAGTRQMAQITVEGSVVETGSTITLGSTYQYYFDVLEVDPGTSSLWTESGFNSATFGVKEVT